MNKHKIWIKKQTFSSICRKKVVLLAPWLKKITLGKSSCGQKSPTFPTMTIGTTGHSNTFGKYNLEILIMELMKFILLTAKSVGTLRFHVSSVIRPLNMPEDISFACFSAKATKYMHVLCSARIYSHLPNMHKAGKHISTKFDFTKFYLL